MMRTQPVIASPRDRFDPRIHVLHLIESLGSGGAERALYTALKHMDAGRIHNTVVMVNDGAELWVEPLRKLGVEVESLGGRSHRHMPGGAARFRRFLRARRPDIVHTQLFPANIIGRTAAWMERIPVVSTVQNVEYAPELWQGGWLPFKRVLARAVDGWTARAACARLVAISSTVRQSAHEDLRYPLSRIELIPNGIDFADVTAVATEPRQSLRAELGLPPDAIVLLHVGRVVVQKGLHYLIPAMPRILAAHANAHLVAVGATTDRAWLNRLQREAEAHGVAANVHFAGERKDIPDLLGECDVFLFPSIVEGLGVALLEAMAMGRACIASQIPSLSEFVTHGVNGWLVPPKEVESLADAVIEVLASPALRERLGAAAIETVRRRFSAEMVAARLTELYEEVANAVDR